MMIKRRKFSFFKIESSNFAIDTCLSGNVNNAHSIHLWPKTLFRIIIQKMGNVLNPLVCHTFMLLLLYVVTKRCLLIFMTINMLYGNVAVLYVKAQCDYPVKDETFE